MTAAQLTQKQKRGVILSLSKGARKGLNAIWFDKLTMTAAQLIPETKSALSS
jgi:hypothetical protein